MPGFLGNDGGFQHAFLGITKHADALGEKVVRYGVVFVNLHSGGLYTHFQATILRLHEEHVIHGLQRNPAQVQFLGFRQITLAGIYDESKRQSACYHRKYVTGSH